MLALNLFANNTPRDPSLWRTQSPSFSGENQNLIGWTTGLQSTLNGLCYTKGGMLYSCLNLIFKNVSAK